MGCGNSKFNKELSEDFLDINEKNEKEKDEFKKFKELLELFELLVTNNDPNSLLFKDIEKYKETTVKNRHLCQYLMEHCEPCL